MAGPGGREVGRVSIRVVPDLGSFSNELKAELQAIERSVLLSIRSELDTSGITEHARLAVEEATAAAGKVHIDTELDGAPAIRAASGVGSSINGILAAAVTLGPALIPLAAGLTAVFAAVSLPLAAAGAGLTAFALVAVPVIKSVTDAAKLLAKAQQKVTDATTDKARKQALLEQAAVIASLNGGQIAALESLNKMKTAFHQLQQALAPDIFKVFNAGLDVFVAALPSIGQLAKAVAPALATIGNNIAAAFKAPEMKSFVDFLASRAAGAIEGIAHGFALIGKGVAGLFVSFAPLSDKIGAGLTSMLTSFSQIGQSNGLKSFIGYIQQVGPQVVAFFASFAHAIAAVAKALAPLGGPVLVVVTGFFTALSAVPKDLLTAIAADILAVVAGLKVWAVIQAILNTGLAAFIAETFALSAVPVVAIIIAIVAAVIALTYGIIQLVKHWDEVVAVVKGIVMAALAKAVSAFYAVKDAVASVLPTVLKFGAILLGVLLPFISIPLLIIKNWSTISSFFAGLWSTISAGVAAAAEAVAGFFTALPGRIGSALAALPGILLDVIVAAGKGMLTALEYAIATLIVLFIIFPKKAAEALLDLGPKIVEQGINAFVMFTEAIKSAASAVIAFFTALPGRIADALATLAGVLVVAAVNSWTAFTTKTTEAATAVISFVTALPGRIGSALASLASTLSGLAVSAWNAFTSATTTAVTAVVNFVTALPGRIVRALESLAGSLSTAASTAWTSFLNGGNTVVTKVIAAAKALPGQIVDAVGDLGKTLYNAGSKIISGFIDGIKSKIDDVKNTLGGLTDKLTSWKGPPGRDAVLLFGAGQLVIGGFLSGLESQYEAVHASLSRFSDDLSVSAGLTATITSSLDSQSTPAPGGAATAGSGTAALLSELRGLREDVRDQPRTAAAYRRVGGVV